MLIFLWRVRFYFFYFIIILSVNNSAQFRFSLAINPSLRTDIIRIFLLTGGRQQLFVLESASKFFFFFIIIVVIMICVTIYENSGSPMKTYISDKLSNIFICI